MKNILGKINSRLEAVFYTVFSHMFKVNEKQIMFFTFQGEYTCNPKYICEQIHKADSKVKCVWVECDKKTQFPEYVTVVKFGSSQYYKELYKSKVLVENAFNFTKRFFIKKKNQIGIQTMHGSLGIKKIGVDANQSKKRNHRGFRSAKYTDYIISNSDFENMVYRTSFWKDTSVKMLGHARNDILFHNDETIVTKVRKFYNIEPDSRLLLYAPTFIRNNKETIENIDYKKLRKALSDKFGGNWYIIERLHPRDSRNSKDNKEKYILNGNKYEDIQELMVAVDFGITDYSSWIYDYVLTEKPGIIYAPDIEEYSDSTGFYYPINTTPFPITTDNNELIDKIEKWSFDTYSEDVQRFIKDKGCIDDGKSSVRIVDFIMNLI